MRTSIRAEQNQAGHHSADSTHTEGPSCPALLIHELEQPLPPNATPADATLTHRLLRRTRRTAGAGAPSRRTSSSEPGSRASVARERLPASRSEERRKPADNPPGGRVPSPRCSRIDIPEILSDPADLRDSALVQSQPDPAIPLRTENDYSRVARLASCADFDIVPTALLHTYQRTLSIKTPQVNRRAIIILESPHQVLPEFRLHDKSLPAVFTHDHQSVAVHLIRSNDGFLVLSTETPAPEEHHRETQDAPNVVRATSRAPSPSDPIT